MLNLPVRYFKTLNQGRRGSFAYKRLENKYFRLQRPRRTFNPFKKRRFAPFLADEIQNIITIVIYNLLVAT